MYKPDERLHKRQLQNKVGLIRLLYYLPMEMTKKEEKKSELEWISNYYIDRASKSIAESWERAIISALNNRPRYLRWIPKKFYVKHFIEVHYQNTRPLVLPVKNWLKIETEFRVYDKLRKKYVEVV